LGEFKLQKPISELYPPIFSEAEVPSYRLPEIGSSESTCRLFEEQIYGRFQIDSPEMEINVFEQDDQALSGLSRRRQLRVSLRNSRGQCEFTILLYFPTRDSHPVPLFLGLNFLGNHTVGLDPSVALPTSSFPSIVEADTLPSQKKRGFHSTRWPLETLLQRGYGVATVFCGDFAPDHPDHFKEGLLRLDSTESSLMEMRGGAIAAWASGLSHAFSALVTLPEIDPTRVAVVGHSRLGKAALWAGANDSRFSIVISNNSGSGGAALFRRRIGERIVHLNGNFPHWFAKAFHGYDEKENELPVDQHQLLAMMAPRAVYIASAEDDKWADPVGEYLALAAAAPAWNEELPLDFPAMNMPVQRGLLGYHVRSGAHDIREYDWKQFLNFTDRTWKRPVA